jgi:hypothetical protein
MEIIPISWIQNKQKLNFKTGKANNWWGIISLRLRIHQ